MKFFIPYSDNKETRKNNWKIPVELLTDYTVEGYYYKLSGVRNFTSMDLRLTGSKNYNALSSILYTVSENQIELKKKNQINWQLSLLLLLPGFWISL